LIACWKNYFGKPDAGEPHVRFDEGGAGNSPLLYVVNGTVLSGYSVDVENRVQRSHGRDGPRSLIVRADGALKTVPFGSVCMLTKLTDNDIKHHPALRSCLASRRGASPTVAAERQGRASGESLVMRSRWLALPPPGATGIKGCPRYGLCSFVVPPRFRACAAGTLDTRTLRRLVVGIGFALAKPIWHWFANGNESLLVK